MKESFFERLQYASESDSLDFKKAQYKFSGASDIEKSELLKDILAMVNAWSTETRHIVIGIEERNPKPNCYHGVHDFIDDSRIQEFVNSKTSRVCLFDWLTCAYKGKDYTVIRIPVQERPVYLKRDYGKLKANTVYVRRGTATAIANPDEMKEMAVPEQSVIPSLQICFFNEGSEPLYSEEFSSRGARLVLSDAIPDYEEYAGMYGVHLLLRDVNKDYYRDYINYTNFVSSYMRIKLAIHNAGDIEARNVKVEINIPKCFSIAHEDDVPSLPSKQKSLIEPMKLNIFSDEAGYTVKEFPDKHQLINGLDCIHAKRTIPLPGKFFCSVESECNDPWEVVVYFDGASEPTVAELCARMSVTEENMEWLEVKEKYLKEN